MVPAALIASAATWLALIARWRRGEPLLEYKPRTPVPWGAPVAMLAVVFVAIALLTAAGADAAAEPVDHPHPLDLAERLVGFIFFQSIVIGGVLFVVAVLYKPSLRDLGLPVYADELVRDIRVGALACLAALGPVHSVQLLMLYLFGPSHHPLVEMVTGGEPNFGVVFLASIAAMVIAPVGEEILFRLLLQGWLEKWVDQRLDRREEPNDDARLTNDEISGSTDAEFVMRHSSLEVTMPPAEPPSLAPARRPHGWLPILVSSLLFAIAHYGYGPDPIALFFLAIILGYVYQRTHRIVPCIVAHALFNSLAMLILWRAVFLNAE
jgi:membrane protease YdiL (CAAX protease family)